MYSPSEFAQGRYLWHFTSVLRLPSEASSPMEGMQAVCAEFVAVAGSQLGWGGSKLLEATSYSYKYSIGGEQHILLMAFWSEDWGYAYCRAFSSDRILALEIERIIKKFLPRITAEELLEYHTLATLSDNQIMMLGDMAEWGDAYSPSLSNLLCEAWKTRSDQLRCSLVWCFQSNIPFWRDFYPLLKESLNASLEDPLDVYVQSAIDMMEFDMRLEGQSED